MVNMGCYTPFQNSQVFSICAVFNEKYKQKKKEACKRNAWATPVLEDQYLWIPAW